MKIQLDFVFFRTVIYGTFALFFLSSKGLFGQGIPKIISDKKNAIQNYLPDYSYAGYYFGEIEIPKKTQHIINATDYGVIVNDILDDSKALLKAKGQSRSQVYRFFICLLGCF